MAKFYFDESVADKVSSGLKDTENNIQSIRKNLNKAITQLEMCDGFDIVSSMNAVESEMRIMERISEKADKGRLVMRAASATVQKYENLAGAVYEHTYYIANRENLGNEFQNYTRPVTDWAIKNDNFYTGLSLGVSDWGDMLTNPLGYERKYTKEAFEGVLEKMIEYKQNEYLKWLNEELDTFIDGIGTAEDMSKYIYSTVSKGAPNFIPDFFEKIGYVGDINKLAPDVLKAAFIDYSEAYCYLEALQYVKSTYEGDEMMSSIVNELYYKYSNKANHITGTFIDFFADKGIGKISSSVFESLLGTGFKVVKTGYEIATDAAAEYTGCKDFADNYKTVAGLVTAYGYTINAYKEVAERIKSGVATEEDYKAYEYLFELNRNIKIEQYTSMIEMETSAEKIESYKQLLEELQEMKLEY